MKTDSHLREQGRRTRAKIGALRADGFAPAAIAEKLSLSNDRVIKLMIEMGLRDGNPRGRYGGRPAAVALGDAVGEDLEGQKFFGGFEAACDKHLADLKRAHPGGSYRDERDIPGFDAVRFLPEAQPGRYTSPGALCADSTDGSYF